MMSEYMFGLIYTRPSRNTAKRLDKICRDEGGYGLSEVNRKDGDHTDVNDGKYQAWFCAPNRGRPFDAELAARVMWRATAETDVIFGR